MNAAQQIICEAESFGFRRQQKANNSSPDWPLREQHEICVYVKDHQTRPKHFRLEAGRRLDEQSVELERGHVAEVGEDGRGGHLVQGGQGVLHGLRDAGGLAGEGLAVNVATFH